MILIEPVCDHCCEDVYILHILVLATVYKKHISIWVQDNKMHG